jgi:hypothetical protein
VSTLLVLVIAIAPVGVASAMPPPDVPDGVVSGRPHQLRIRPVLATVAAPDPDREVSRRARATAAAAVASCDLSPVRNTSTVATTRRSGDDPGACVVLQVPAGSGRRGRYLLGPAVVTGVDLARATTSRTGEDTYVVTLDLSDHGTTVFDDFARQRFHERIAVTLDATVQAAPVVQADRATFAPTGGRVDASLSRGMPRSNATDLATRYEAAIIEPIVEMASTATMTRAARQVLGRTRPRLDGKVEFARNCALADAEDDLVLGCYTGGTVHVLRVDRADLAPVMTVATAHEMLHAAYADLSPTTRHRIDALLDVEFAMLDDPLVKEQIEAYDVSDPTERHNELHSILGTEVRVLGPELERYYARYFRDRTRVVEANERYLAVFRPVRARFTELRDEIDARKGRLDELSARIDDAAARADNLSSEIEARRAQGRIAESNDLVDGQNAAASEGNALIDEYNTLVEEFNARVDEYNALRENELGLLNAVSAVPLAVRPTSG